MSMELARLWPLALCASVMYCEYINAVARYFGFGPIVDCTDSSQNDDATNGSVPTSQQSNYCPADPSIDDSLAPMCVDPTAALWAEPNYTPAASPVSDDDSDDSSPSAAMALPLIVGGLRVVADEAANGPDYMSERGSREVQQAADIVREAQRRLLMEHGIEMSATELRNTFHYEIAQDFKTGRDGRRNHGSLEHYSEQVDALVSFYAYRAEPNSCTAPTAVTEGLITELRNTMLIESLPEAVKTAFINDQRNELNRELNRLIGEHNATSYETLPNDVRMEFERRWHENYSTYINNYWSEPNQAFPRFSSARTEVTPTSVDTPTIDPSLPLETRLQMAEEARRTESSHDRSDLPLEARLSDHEREQRPWESRETDRRAGFEGEERRGWERRSERRRRR